MAIVPFWILKSPSHFIPPVDVVSLRIVPSANPINLPFVNVILLSQLMSLEPSPFTVPCIMPPVCLYAPSVFMPELFSPVVVNFIYPPFIVALAVTSGSASSFETFIASPPVASSNLPASIITSPFPQSMPSFVAITVIVGEDVFVRPTMNFSFVWKPSFAA